MCYSIHFSSCFGGHCEHQVTIEKLALQQKLKRDEVAVAETPARKVATPAKQQKEQNPIAISQLRRHRDTNVLNCVSKLEKHILAVLSCHSCKNEHWQSISAD